MHGALRDGHRRCLRRTRWLAVVVAWPAASAAQLEAPEVPPETQADVAAPESAPASAPRIEDEVVRSASLVLPERHDTSALPALVTARPALRSSSGSFEVLPIAELDLDSSYARAGETGTNGGVRARRVQAGLVARFGSRLHLVATAEYAAPPGVVDDGSGVGARIAAADLYVAIAPWGGQRLTLQVGQFDAPFTLENRTRDGALDFRERSLAVRALGIPDHRDVGAMVAGRFGEHRLLYSVGVFNGDGPRFVNADNQYDLMGRFFVAPFSGVSAVLDQLTIGASGRIGDRVNTVALPAQTTPGGLRFLDFAPYLAAPGGGGRATSVQLRQVGRMQAVGAEVNAPFGNRLGARGEVVWRKSPLSEEDVSGGRAPVILGGANLIGWAAYGELWGWIIGDDRVIGDRHGIEPIPSPKGATANARALMVAVRGERLDEELSLEYDAANLNLHDPSVGGTRVTAGEIAVSYWHTRRVRATADYTFSHFDGTTSQVRALPSPNVHEVGVRLALAL